MMVGASIVLARSTRKASPGPSVSPDLPRGPINPNTRAALPLTSRLRVVAVSCCAAVAALAARNRGTPAAAAAIPVVKTWRRGIGGNMEQLPKDVAGHGEMA